MILFSENLIIWSWYYFLDLYTRFCVFWFDMWPDVFTMPRSWTFFVFVSVRKPADIVIHSLRRAFYACSVVWCDMIFDAIRSVVVPWKPHSGLWVSLSTCARERPKHCTTWAVKMRTERGWKKCWHKQWQAVCWVWWEGLGWVPPIGPQ